MVYRDEREALRQRALAAENEVNALRQEAGRARHLERKVDDLERELALHRPPSPRRTDSARPIRLVGFLALALGAMGASWFTLEHAHARHPNHTLRVIPVTAQVARGFEPDLALTPVVIGADGPASRIAVWGECEPPTSAASAGLRAIDELGGRSLWTACGLGAPLAELHAIDAGRTIAVWSRKILVALDPQTGTEIWRDKSPAPIVGVCVRDDGKLSAELEGRGIWEIDPLAGEASEVDLAAGGCRPETPRDAWSSAANGSPRAIVDAASLPDGRLPRLDLDVTRAGPIAGGTLVLGVREGRPAVAFLESSTPKWTRDLPLPSGVTPDGTTPTIAIAEDQVVFVAYQPAREAGLRIASLGLANGAVLWSAPAGKSEWTLHAVSGIALTPHAILVREPWHLYALARTDGSPRFDLP